MTIVDDLATAKAKEKDRLRRGWERWLRSFRWDFLATGTWDSPNIGHLALGTVKRWLARYDGSYAAVGLQRGPLSLTPHVHVLIGGIGRSGLVETHLRASWVKSGHMKLDRYQGHRGGVAYLVQQADEIELIGNPLTFTPRRKRSRR